MRPFRFGVTMFLLGEAQEWADKCRLAETLDYDTIHVPDRLGFPALVRVADATVRPRVGTLVLDAGLRNPGQLAQEACVVNRLTDGRLELGLGAGHGMIDAMGPPPRPAAERVTHLARMVETLEPPPRGPTLLLGGHGDRLLTLAARHADVVSFTGAATSEDGTQHLVSAEVMQERAAFFRAAAGDRAARIESHIPVRHVEVTDDRRGVVEELRATAHGLDSLTVDELLDVPTLLVGTVEEIIDQLRAHRDRFGFSYISVLETRMVALAPVVEKLSWT